MKNSSLLNEEFITFNEKSHAVPIALLSRGFSEWFVFAGKYVLGWRYDCEAAAQVWSNCADTTLVKQERGGRGAK